MKQGSPALERRNNASPVHQSGPGVSSSKHNNEILSLSPRNLKDIYNQGECIESIDVEWAPAGSVANMTLYVHISAFIRRTKL